MLAVVILLTVLAQIADEAPKAPVADAKCRSDIIQMPSFRRMPHGGDLGHVYPKVALANHIGGESEMACDVTAQGKLTGCKVTRETPPDAGFGAAEVSLARQFLLDPKTGYGCPVAGGRIIIPMRWSFGP